LVCFFFFSTYNYLQLDHSHSTTTNKQGEKAVLFTVPQIPAGMTGSRRNPQESSRMRLESTGIHRNETGIRSFLQEWNWNLQELNKIAYFVMYYFYLFKIFIYN
jgi:hypothetical protein